MKCCLLDPHGCRTGEPTEAVATCPRLDSKHPITACVDDLQSSPCTVELMQIVTEEGIIMILRGCDPLTGYPGSGGQPYNHASVGSINWTKWAVTNKKIKNERL